VPQPSHLPRAMRTLADVARHSLSLIASEVVVAVCHEALRRRAGVAIQGRGKKAVKGRQVAGEGRAVSTGLQMPAHGWGGLAVNGGD
jgi:hypothetical protein